MNHDGCTGTAVGEGRDTEERRVRLRRRLLVFACCVPMIAVVGFLVATGVVGVGAAVVALLCVALMPLLHGGGGHGHGGGRHRH